MNIGIIGLGLMGGSFARTLVKKTDNKVYGFDISESTMLKAEMLKAFHEKLNIENAKELDMLILAVTSDKVKGILEEYLPHLKSGTVVTDFCGTKRDVVFLMKEFSKKNKDIIFIGGHPMAGREVSGIEHSTTTLFDKASMVLVNINADIFKLDEIKHFYLSLGFDNVEITKADIHDSRIAFTSQLCHIVSNAFIKNKSAEYHDGFSAGSYKDLTRVAKLDPKMWANLMITNKDYLSEELTELIGNLTDYKKALDSGNKEELEKLLAVGNNRKIEIDSKKK